MSECLKGYPAVRSTKIFDSTKYTLMLMGGYISLFGCVDQRSPQADSVTTPQEVTNDQMIPVPEVLIDATPSPLERDQGIEDAAVGVDMSPSIEPVEPVEISLMPPLVPAPEGEGDVRAFRSAGEDDLLESPTRLGQVGDYVLENDHVRFIIEDDDRVIGPCPYGGNVIDGASLLEGATDQIGEVCLLINLSQTLKPERYDILEDGSEGRAILAVTGHLELLDFINVAGFASAYLPITLRLGFDTERLLPLAVTIYYILTPNARGVRVVTALRNDGAESAHFPLGHLIDSGGEVTPYSPYSPTGGFGAGNFSVENINEGPILSILGFYGVQGTHIYQPDPVPELRTNRPYPVSGTYITISGVSVSLLRTQQILNTLLTPSSDVETTDAFSHLSSGETMTLGHWHWVGTGSLASAMDFAWREVVRQEAVEDRTLVLGEVSGLISSGGLPLSGVHVSLVTAEGRTLNQALSDAEGRYSLSAPIGEGFTLKAYRMGHGRRSSMLTLTEAGESVDFELSMTAALSLTVTRESGDPTPAKLTVICATNPCPDLPEPQEIDLRQDRLPEGVLHVGFVGVDGRYTLELPPGQYRVVLSRGPLWSVWPSLEGEEIDLIAGETLTLDATLDEVVDRSGWLSGDFHVHGINSPDAPVSLENRVLSFLSEGVDVLVSTDHDYITDYAPTIIQLGATEELYSMVGEELTTFDYGHYNGFPLQRDPASRNGGAWDWAGGPGPGHPPREIFEWMHSHPGEQVVAVNHASGGYFSAIRADLLRGTSLSNPLSSRLLEIEGATPEDTGLWSEGFTAMEIYNGFGMSNFHKLFRAWLTLVGRGFTPTATAVSDTHKLYSSIAGGPRSWVYVGGEGRPTLDEEAFAQAINRGQLSGSNGPLLTAFASLTSPSDMGADGTDQVSLGETLSILEALQGAQGDTVDVYVTVEARCPDWMTLTEAQIFVNIDQTSEVDLGPGIFSDEPSTPTASLPLTLREAGASRGPQSPKERVYEARFTLPLNKDSYIVTTITGTGSLFPVLHRATVLPFAYTNPIYIDADGGGYNTPPLLHLISPPPEEKSATTAPGVKSSVIEAPSEQEQERLLEILRHEDH